MWPATPVSPVSYSRSSPLFDNELPDPQLRISVIIPARNEADGLALTLDALRNQLRLDGRPVPAREFEVLLLLNNCTDHSPEVAQAYQRRHPTFPLRLAVIQLRPEQANVGTARRLLMDAAHRRLRRVGRSQGIIASTDGDTIADRYWLDQIQAEVDKGCEVVGGRILTCPDGSPVRINHLRDVTYRMLKARLEDYLDPLPFDPWPRHFQHFGASLAITCAAYERVGGLPSVPHLEDEALYRALLRADVRIRKSPFVKVTTSTRLQGRVAVGFSEQLQYWQRQNQANQCQISESAEAIVRRIQNRRRLRDIWRNGLAQASQIDLYAIATELLIDVHWLAVRLHQVPYFGELWDEVETQMATGAWGSHWKPVPITLAIRELRQVLRSLPA
ncbi:glycosyltransferase family 2 protein [Spirosoma koreense]